MDDTIKTLQTHIIGDLTYLLVPLLRSYPPGSNTYVEALLSVHPLPDDYVRLAEDKGVTFIPDAKGSKWVAIKDDIMVESLSHGSVFECAKKVCETYSWSPPMRGPQSFLVVSSYLGFQLHAMGATIVNMRHGGNIWVRDLNCEPSQDPMLARVATHLAITREDMPRVLRSAA